MRIEVTVRVDDVLAKLQPLAKAHNVERLSSLGRIVSEFEIKADIDEEGLASGGYVNAEQYREHICDDLAPNINDLRDGLRALINGDRTMAATLLHRAFDEWEDAKSTVEDVLLSRTVHDSRQPLLLVA